MSPRKRFSAFEDFPGDEAASTADSVSQKKLPEQLPEQDTALVERIERLKPSQMLPDRYQPRRLLPPNIRTAFFAGETDCYQAARDWLSLAKQDSAYRTEVERLLAMGNSFEDHGQIKPITGSWFSTEDGRYIFQIETGERRFWAACLRAVVDQLSEEPLLRVEVVTKTSRQRQVLENRHSEPPSAVGQACEIASLILAEMNVPPDEKLLDDYDFFRMARSQRMPAGLWERITPIMQLTRPRMVQLLNILQLPTPLLDLADRYRIPERVLREVLALPRNQWERMLLLSAQNNLTSDEVAEAAAVQDTPHPAPAPTPKQPIKVAISGLRRFANALGDLDEVSQEQALDELANELVGSGQAEGMLNLLDELARLVQARLTRRKKV